MWKSNGIFKKLLKLSELNEVAGYKINAQKSTVFVHTSND